MTATHADEAHPTILPDTGIGRPLPQSSKRSNNDGRAPVSERMAGNELQELERRDRCESAR